MAKTYQDGWHDGFRAANTREPYPEVNEKVGREMRSHIPHSDAYWFPENINREETSRGTKRGQEILDAYKKPNTNRGAYRHSSIIMRLDEIAALLEKISDQLARSETHGPAPEAPESDGSYARWRINC